MINTAKNHIVSTFFQHQVIIKMFHFQTQKKTSHTAADIYLTQFLLNSDLFMEILQGLHGMVSAKSLSINVEMVTDATIDRHLGTMSVFLTDLTLLDKPLPSELDAVRTTMLGEIAKLRYLLNFE